LYHFRDKAINLWKIAISGQRYYGTLRSPLCRRNSICLLSSVCDVRNFAAYLQGLTFRQYSAPADSLWTRTVCVKILDRSEWVCSFL